MDELKKRILREAEVTEEGFIMVDRFLNHQVDVLLLDRMGHEIADRFRGSDITKVLTAETSGIAIACFAARAFKVPLVFAKKYRNAELSDTGCYQAKGFSAARQQTYFLRVSKEVLSSDDNVLIVDDFLSQGIATLALSELLEKAGASCAGISVAIEKAYQEGGRILRKMGIRIEPLCVIRSVNNGKIEFL